MEDKFLRKTVKSVLSELMKGAGEGNSSFPTSSFNQFPYNIQNSTPRYPEEINTKKDYIKDFVELSTNQDLYSFPIEEFTKGLQIEKQKNDRFNILDIATVVIEKIKQSPHFYSDLLGN